ncbi:MAG: DUF2142 domain-containing protein [Lachnospiraceae bacterium]|nr:DUF2142 domain-containing protein [Lachnospiraceae bacterium]
MKEKRREILYLTLCIVFFVLIFCVFGLRAIIHAESAEAHDMVVVSEESAEYPLIFEGSDLYKSGKVRTLSILFTSYANDENGEIQVELLNNGRTVGSWVKPAREIKDTAYQMFMTDGAVKYSNDHNLRVRVFGSAIAEGTFAIAVTEEGAIVSEAETEVSIAGGRYYAIILLLTACIYAAFCYLIYKSSGGTKSLGGVIGKASLSAVILFILRAFYVIVLRKPEYGFTSLSFIPIFTTSFVLMWTLIAILKKEVFFKDEVSFFTFAAIPMMAVFLILFPPFSTNDAEAHVIQCYRDSNMMLGKTTGEGYTMSDADRAYLVSVAYGDQPFWYPETRYYLGQSQALHVAGTKIGDYVPSQREYMDGFRHMGTYSVVSYLPIVVGMSLARLLGLNSFWIFMLGRILMCAAYILLCRRAIRLSPYAKPAFAFVCAFPMSVLSAASISYDGMTILSAACFIAAVLNAAFGSEDKGDGVGSKKWIKRYAELTIYAILLGTVKGGAFLVLLPLCILLFIRGEKRQRILYAGVPAAGFLSLAVSKALASAGSNFQMHAADAGKLSAGFVFSHPFEYLTKAVTSYIYNMDYYIGSAIGTRLGWDEAVIPGALICVMIIVAYISVLASKGYELSGADRFVIVLTLLIPVILTPGTILRHASLTDYDLYGIRGRYYIPVILLLLVMLSGSKTFKVQADKGTKLTSVSHFLYEIFMVTQAAAVLYMLIRFTGR